MSSGLLLNVVRWLSDLANSGIYVLEGLSRGQTIPVRRSPVVAFVGSSPRGPVGIPVKIESVAEYRKRFGSANQPGRLETQLTQFFDNGGTNAIVVRVCCSSRRNKISLPGPAGTFVMAATDPGPMEFLRASIDYDGIAAGDQDRFNLVIHRLASANSPFVEEQEIFSGLSVNPESPDYAGHILLRSEMIYVDGEMPSQRPLSTLAPGIEVGKSYVYANADWEEPGELSDYDLIGSDSDGSGLFALNQISVVDLVCLIPDKPDLGPVAFFAAERFCRKRYAMLLMDPPAQWKSVADAVESSRQNGYASANIVTYFPRPMRLEGEVETGHASVLGAIAGRLAAGDAERGVWESLAEDAVNRDRIHIRCQAWLAVRVDQQDCNILARSGVNCLRDIGAGMLELNGLVTFAHGEDVVAAWDDLRKRRIALFVIESIARATRWAAFQDDERDVWPILEKQIDEFLRAIFDAGALAGHSVEEACYMIHDSQPDDGSTRIRFIVGIALDKNGFLAFRFTQDRVDCEVREVAWQPGIALAS